MVDSPSSLASPSQGGAREIVLKLCREVLAPLIEADGGEMPWPERDVQMWLYENARMPLSTYKRGGMWGMHNAVPSIVVSAGS